MTWEQESREAAQNPGMEHIFYFWKHGNACNQYVRYCHLKNRFSLIGQKGQERETEALKPVLSLLTSGSEPTSTIETRKQDNPTTI